MGGDSSGSRISNIAVFHHRTVQPRPYQGLRSMLAAPGCRVEWQAVTPCSGPQRIGVLLSWGLTGSRLGRSGSDRSLARVYSDKQIVQCFPCNTVVIVPK